MSQDALTSTAALLQLARSLNVAHQLKQWKPQRGIKLVSWGGADIGNMGMLQHIKVRFLSGGIEREREISFLFIFFAPIQPCMSYQGSVRFLSFLLFLSLFFLMETAVVLQLRSLREKLATCHVWFYCSSTLT